MERTIDLKEIPRRAALALIGGAAAATALPAGADPAAVAGRIRDITGGAKPGGSGALTLDLPELAEDGNAVKLGFAVDSPMTEADHVKAVHVLADDNPFPDVARFNFSPACGACRVSTRMRLARSQNVIVIAERSDGTFHMAETNVKVTIGGCGS